MLDTDLHSIQCPHCGEPIEISIDPSQTSAEYIEDCSVCCRPINLRIEIDASNEPFVSVSADGE